jgi:hypothetical protein
MISKLFWLLVLVALGWGAYYFWNQIPDTPKNQTLGGYVDTLQRDEAKAKVAASNVNVTIVQQAINKYKADKGNLPASLQDLAPDYLDHIPGGVQYDPSTGAVSPAQ